MLWVLQVLWKSYIDFEIEQEEYENTRNLYKRLLQRTQHVKVGVFRASEHQTLRLLHRHFLSPGLDQLRQVRAVGGRRGAAADVPAGL